MIEEMDNALDGLLREHFEGPVLDEGFCDRVMGELPAARRRKKWPMALGTYAGVVTCWFSLWSVPITAVGSRDWLSGELSPAAITLFISMMSMALMALVWAIAEADDRSGQPLRRMIGR